MTKIITSADEDTSLFKVVRVACKCDDSKFYKVLDMACNNKLYSLSPIQ